MLPTCSYINNTRHFYRNRIKKDGAYYLRFARTVIPHQSTKEAIRRCETKKSYGVFNRLSSKDNICNNSGGNVNVK
ncbi:MAG: hypothetical protein P4M11_07670 [Candidatus Pacebacteria bacterium]|nr:hypothetical protein [Candidatus Paceibacterota bacterium]